MSSCRDRRLSIVTQTGRRAMHMVVRNFPLNIRGMGDLNRRNVSGKMSTTASSPKEILARDVVSLSHLSLDHHPTETLRQGKD